MEVTTFRSPDGDTVADVIRYDEMEQGKIKTSYRVYVESTIKFRQYDFPSKADAIEKAKEVCDTPDQPSIEVSK